MKTNKMQVVVALTLFCSGLQSNVYADSSNRQYGKGYPFEISDLPAKSKLRQRLESLPPQAKQKALENLQTFSFPESDTELLRIDNEGGIFYDETDAPKPDVTTGATTDVGTASITLPTVDTFKLHSRPNSTKKVFLDFDGHQITATAWNSTVATYNALPFDLDSNPTSFSADERARIAEIWHRVADDFAPFDIDVTTEQPTTFNATTGRILVTKNVDANGVAMPSSGAGGVAYVGVWGRSNYASYYSPALVYYNALGSGFPPYVAEAASHEFGHNLGLSHDGVIDGQQNPKCVGSTGYYCGLGNGFVSWSAIMGVGYYTNVTEWSKGEYLSANNTQDDVTLIGNQLGLINDNDDGSFAKAKPLAVSATGSITSTTPQDDPSNADPVNKGIIESATDVDTFWFDAAAGTATITVKPAWAAFYRTSTRGANLDIEARIYDQVGNVVASDDSISETSATISTTLTGGRYYLMVGGVGNTVTPYSDYGSHGEYFISGNVTPSAADTTSPSPNPMAWAVQPAVTPNGITMTAATATDDSGIVEYQFQCVTGGQNCQNSNWQSNTTYTVTGLAAGTSYTFQVVARDGKGNMTQASPTASVTTNSNVAPVAVNDNATVKVSTSVAINPLANDTDANGDTLSVVSISSPISGKATLANNVITYTAGTKVGSDTFSYTITDGKGANATGSISVNIKKR